MAVRQGLQGSKEVGGGLYKKMEANQAPVNYAGVKSIDSSMKKFNQGGGKIVTVKTEVRKTGWVGAGLDPAGNAIGVWEAISTSTRRSRRKSNK